LIAPRFLAGKFSHAFVQHFLRSRRIGAIVFLQNAEAMNFDDPALVFGGPRDQRRGAGGQWQGLDESPAIDRTINHNRNSFPYMPYICRITLFG